MGKRNASVETFRCLLMFLIVLGHAFSHGIWSTTTGWWTLLFSTLIIWHVDGFVGISGWFGIKFSWMKFARLWGLCLFYTVLGAAYQYCFARPSFSIKSLVVHGGWFTGTYMMLMMIAPILNAGLEQLHKKSPRALLAAWGGVALGVMANWCPGHLMTGMKVGGGHDYSILTMIFVYVSARCARLLELDRLPLRKLMLAPIAFVGGIVVLGGVQQLYMVALKGLPFEPSSFRYWTVYQAPHVAAMAIGMVLIFVSHVKVPAVVGKFADFCAPSMFGVYLMSDTTSFGPLLYRIPQKWFSDSNIPWLVIILTAISTFLICLAFDLCRRFALRVASRPKLIAML